MEELYTLPAHPQLIPGDAEVGARLSASQSTRIFSLWNLEQ